MQRLDERELLESEDLDPQAVARAYRELQHTHRFLGNTDAVLRLLRREFEPSVAPTSHLAQGRTPNRVLDIGCGQGAFLLEIRQRLGIDVVGIDLRPAPADSAVPILTGNAVTDPLPAAHVAVCLLMAHHLSEPEIAQLIRNVSRCCDRLILLDLVRHPVPLALFRAFVAPLLCRINALDGQTSIRRAYTADEMRRIVAGALDGCDRPVRSFRHIVAPLWIRQVVDISWG